MHKQGFWLSGLIILSLSLMFVSADLVMEGNACSSADTTDSDGDGIQDDCDLCPLASSSGADTNLDGCVDGTPDSEKRVKLSDFTVISEEAIGQVVVEQDATIVKKILAQRSHSTLLVNVPAGASNIHVFAIDNLLGAVNIDASVTITPLATKTQVRIDIIPRKDLEIVYTIPGPTREEALNFIHDAKQVTVSSGFHFTNVLARTLIRPLPPSLVRLDHFFGGIRIPVQNVTLIDADGDGLIEQVEWIIPHLSTEVFLIGLNTAFATARSDNPSLPSGWYVQSDGRLNQDDFCVDLGAWILTNQTYSGVNGVMFRSYLDRGCGLKLPTFTPNVGGSMNMTFNYWSNFTSPSEERDSTMEIANVDNDNECGLMFNGTTMIEQQNCVATITDLGGGWNQVNVTNWVITNPTQPISLYIFSTFILNQLGEEGVMIFDDMKVILPS